VEGTHTRAGAKREEEGAAETTCDELTTAPMPQHRSEGKEVENSAVTLSLEEGRGEGEGGLRFSFYFFIILLCFDW